MKILAVESSTSSAKALLFDTDTGDMKIKARAYRPAYENRNIHKLDEVYGQMLAAAKEALGGCGEADIIVLCNAWHSVSLCSRQMEPQLPELPWSYTGASQLCRKLREDSGYSLDYYQRTGCMVNSIYPFFKLKMLKKMGFSLEQYRILGQGSYNTYRMTGIWTATECLASGTGLLNIHSKQYDSKIMEELGITEENLPKLVRSDTLLSLGKEAAATLGLKQGIPVIPANSDGGLNQIGAQTDGRRVMTFSVGTSAALRLSVKTPILPEKPELWCYLSPETWLSGAATSGACNCIDWFKSRFAGNMSYRELEKDVLPSSGLPVFLPFVYGERCPGWKDERRGQFAALSPDTTLKELYFSVQEGILFNLYQCYETLTRLHGIPEIVKLSGGILNSQRWTRMCVDIFGVEMETDSQYQGSLVGAVVFAAKLLKEKMGTEITGHVRKELSGGEKRQLKPDAGRRDFYIDRYRKYLELYQKTGGTENGNV